MSVDPQENPRIPELQTWADALGAWHVAIEPGPIACADPALLAAFRAKLAEVLDILDAVVTSHNQRIRERTP